MRFLPYIWQIFGYLKVMDYSLLVGKNEITHDLVVGIIDYLRPFSIDKMIESQVKKGAGYFQVVLYKYINVSIQVVYVILI